MDEALRRSERDEDFAERAHALRRAGRSLEAKRVLQDHAYAGNARAFLLLDEWFPLEGACLRLTRPPAGEEEERPWAGTRRRLALLALGDPRLDRHVRVPQGDEPGAHYVYRISSVADLRAASRVERVEAYLISNPVAAPLELTETETRALCERAGKSGNATLLAACLNLAARHGLVDVVPIESAISPNDSPAATRRALQLLRDLELEGARPSWVRPLLRDPLTHCLNSSVQPELLLSLRPGSRLVRFDLDHLILINDRLGPGVGDHFLRDVGTHLLTALGDRVIRWGGDEFVSALEPGEPDLPESIVHVTSTPEPVTLSVGVALVQEAEDPRDVFDRAEHALYAAKREGRARIVVA